MLERVWRKGNPPTLLVGMQTSTTTMENSVEISFKKLEIELPYDCTVGHMIVLLGIQLLGLYAQQSHC